MCIFSQLFIVFPFLGHPVWLKHPLNKFIYVFGSKGSQKAPSQKENNYRRPTLLIEVNTAFKKCTSGSPFPMYTHFLWMSCLNFRVWFGLFHLIGGNSLQICPGKIGFCPRIFVLHLFTSLKVEFYFFKLSVHVKFLQRYRTHSLDKIESILTS